MKKIVFLLLAVALVSCNDDDTTQKQKIDVDTHAACVIDINQYNTEQNTILTYTDSVYNSSGTFLGVITHKDTLPTLGTKTETFETERTITNGDGDEVYVDTTINHLNRYTIYINLSKNSN